MQRTSLALLLALFALPASAQETDLFGPYEELIELLNAKTPKTPTPKVDDASPVRFVLHGAKLQGVAAENVVRFEATFDVELTSKDWVVVPIGLEGASLEEAAEGSGRPAVAPMSVLRRGLSAEQAKLLPERGYGLLVKGGGRQQPTVRFAVPITTRPGRSSFELELPGAAISELTVGLPQARGASASGALASNLLPPSGEVTRLQAYYGPGAKARVAWNPRPKQTVEGPTEQRDPLVFADVATALRMDEGVLQVSTRVSYRVHQAPCGSFTLRYPKGYTLLGVSAPGRRAYPTPVTKGDAMEITIQLGRKVSGSYALQVRLERTLEEGVSAVEFPRIVTVGTERETGVLAARTSEFLSLEPTRQQGLSQMDASELSAKVAGDLGWKRRGAGAPLAFRYLRQPYALNLKSSPIEPEVEGRLSTLVMLKNDEVALATTVRYVVQKRGIFGVRLRLPQGFQLLECGPARIVKDRRVEPATEAEREAGLGDVLAVDFTRQLGERESPFDLEILGLLRRAPQPETEAVALDMPRLGLIDVAKESGLLVVGAQSQLKLNLETKSGLLPVALGELAGLAFPYGANRGEELIFGFRYARPDGVAATFKAQQREPKVTARVETLVDAQEDRVRVNGTIVFNVQYARIDRVRLEVPADLGIPGALKFDTGGIKSSDVEVREDSAIWTLALQGTRIGTFPIKFSYDLKHNDFSAGQQRKVTLRTVKVLDCFSEVGDIALKKHENVVVDEWDRVGIEKRDKRALPPGLSSDAVVQAYRYVGHPYSLTLRITKYDFKSPLGIEVQHLHQDELVASNGSVKAEATLSVRNDSEQSLTVVLPPGAALQRIKVDGRNANPTTGRSPEGLPTLQIHLGEVKKQRRDEPFQIRIRYDLPAQDGVDGLQLEALSFPLAAKTGEAGADAVMAKFVPIARFTRAVYLPQDEVYLELEADATKHWHQTGFWQQVRRSLGVPSEAQRTNLHRGLESAQQAVRQLKGMADKSGGVSGLYPELQLPHRRPFLLETLDDERSLRVHSMSLWGFYALAGLVLVLVVGVGVGVDKKRLLHPAIYPAGVAALSVLGAILFSDSLRPFCGCALLGAGGLGAVWLVRGAWREVTVAGSERAKARADEQARVAKARAHAAEAEAQLASGQGGQA